MKEQDRKISHYFNEKRQKTALKQENQLHLT